MPTFFDQQVALVTAAGAGIDCAIALRLATEGATVVASDVNDAAGAETVSMIETAGGRAAYAHANVAVADEVEALVPFAQCSGGWTSRSTTPASARCPSRCRRSPLPTGTAASA